MTIPSPFAYDGLLYLNGGTSKVSPRSSRAHPAISLLRTGAKLNDFVAWLQPKAGTYLPTELAYEGGIYVLTHTGILTRFDAKNGAQTYKARIGTGGDFTASPWGYNGKIFCLSEEGKTYVIAAGDKFELLAFERSRRNGAGHPGPGRRPPAAAHGESSYSIRKRS